MSDLKHRLLRGGLPPFFTSGEAPEKDFQEWMDDYWSKDIQELFRLERRSSFQRFVELILAQSDGMFEASSLAAPCEVSRTTIANYLKVLEATMVAHVVHPFSSHRSTEIVAAPRVYGFDTGFVCTYRGWQSLRDDDLGPLWEHFVLNEMHAKTQDRNVLYWRDKRGHEVDFVLARRRQAPTAIECKWKAARFEPSGMCAFRRQYPSSDNLVVAQDVDRPYSRTHGDLTCVTLGCVSRSRHFESNSIPETRLREKLQENQMNGRLVHMPKRTALSALLLAALFAGWVSTRTCRVEVRQPPGTARARGIRGMACEEVGDGQPAGHGRARSIAVLPL